MRVTVNLDADTERLVRNAAGERGLSFKAVLNDAIRKGLGAPRPARAKRFVQKTRFVQRTYDMGFNADFRWDKALAMADALDDEELVRRMAVRK